MTACTTLHCVLLETTLARKFILTNSLHYPFVPILLGKHTIYVFQSSCGMHVQLTIDVNTHEQWSIIVTGSDMCVSILLLS